jgi:hypothetical protein
MKTNHLKCIQVFAEFWPLMPSSMSYDDNKCFHIQNLLQIDLVLPIIYLFNDTFELGMQLRSRDEL